MQADRIREKANFVSDRLHRLATENDPSSNDINYVYNDVGNLQLTIDRGVRA